MITKERQSKWLEIISLALDINRGMGGTYIFAGVQSHIDSISLILYDKGWGRAEGKPLLLYIGEGYTSEDLMVALLTKVIDCEMLYDDLFKIIKDNLNLGTIKDINV